MEKPTVRVKHSPSRCPYCHEDVSSVEAVVCRDCLARHHAGCWREQGSCASCHSTSKLVNEDDVPDRDPGAWVRGRRARRAERAARRAQASTGFMGLNQTGLIVFVCLFMTCLPLAFLPWLLPSCQEDG